MNTKRLLIGMLSLIACLTIYAYGDHHNRKVDSLEAVLRSSRTLSDEERMGAYRDLMWGYLSTDGRRCRAYALKALELASRNDWKNARADALRVLGMSAYGANNYERAIQYYNQALTVTESMRADKRYKESDIDDNLSALYGSLGNLYNIQDKAHLAIAYYQRALPIFEKYRWLESTAILYYNVGQLYDGMGNTEEAEQNYLRSVEVARESGDSLQIAIPHKGLAGIYIGRGDYSEAEKAVNVLYEYFSHHIGEDKEDYLATLFHMAHLEMKGHGNPARAEKIVREALTLLDEETGTEQRADIYNLCCEVAMEKRQWQEALRYAHMAIDTDSMDTFSDIGTYVYLTQIYAELGDKEKAKGCATRIYNGMKDFSTQHYQSGLSQMQVLYDTKQKETTIRQLERERRGFLWGGILVALILLLTALLFFLLWRSIRLSKKSAVFKARLDGELAERQRIARDLHDGLGGMLSLLRLKVDSETPKAETMQLLDDTSRELRRVAHHLLPEQLLHGGLASALADFAISIPGARFHTFGSDQRLPQDIEVVLYRCAYELVNNALKHAEASQIDIQLMQQSDHVSLTVSDNGRGMDASATQGNGVGLQNIRQRIAHYNGHLDIIATEGQGTEINVTLPL